MLERFHEAEGRRRLVETIARQTVVNGDLPLANDIADACELVEYQPQAVLITQSHTDCDVYLLLSGRVAIEVNGVEVATREAGTHVGEMAALDPAASRSATVTALVPTAAARLTEPQLNSLAQSYPHIWRRFAVELANRLNQRARFIRVPNDRPHVFIGSSTEMLPIARAIQDGLHNDDIAITLWTQGVFRPSSTNLDDLLLTVQRSDFGVLVVGPDDTLRLRGEKIAAPRDNVIFELGLFAGALGRHRVLLVKPRARKLRLPTDLLGFTPIEYDSDDRTPTAARLAPVCASITCRVAELGPK